MGASVEIRFGLGIKNDRSATVRHGSPLPKGREEERERMQAGRRRGKGGAHNLWFQGRPPSDLPRKILRASLEDRRLSVGLMLVFVKAKNVLQEQRGRKRSVAARS